jgi:SCY1-like protein 1
MGNTSALPFRKEELRGIICSDGSSARFAWSMSDGSANSDSTKRVTIFQFPADHTALKAVISPSVAPPKADASTLALAQLAARKHVGLVHPNILKVEAASGHEAASSGAPSGSVFMVTEPALPLFVFLASSSAASVLAAAPMTSAIADPSGEPTPELVQAGAALWLAAGAFAIGSALSFLHGRGITHGAVGPWSVFVTPSGEWKLGFMATVLSDSEPPSPAVRSEFPSLMAAMLPGQWGDPAGYADRVASDWRGLAACITGAAKKTADIARHIHSPVATGDPGSVDLLAEGKQGMSDVVSVLGHSVEAALEEGAREGIIHASWVPWLRRLLQPEPARRAGARAWASAIQPSLTPFPSVECLSFLAELPLKTAIEKQSFFGGLPATVSRLPRCLREGMLLPKLLDAMQYGHAEGGGTAVLAPVLMIGAGMQPEEYKQRVVPAVIRLFSSRDRATRVQLMRHAEALIPHIDPATLANEVWPRALEGLGDTAPALRESTLKAMPTFAAHLPMESRTKVIGVLSRLASDSELAIRANTAVCAAMCAPHVTVTERSNQILPLLIAMGRDPEEAARAAATRSMTHLVTGKNVDQPTLTTKGLAKDALAAAGVACADPTPAVRKEGLKMLRACLDALEKRHERLVAEAAKPQLPAPAAVPATSTAGLANWVATVASSTANSAIAAAAGIAAEPTSLPAPRPTRVSPPVRVNVAAPVTAPVKATPTIVETLPPGPSDAGWGDLDSLVEWDEPAAAEAPPPARPTTIKLPKSDTKAKNPAQNGGWDFEEW